MQATDLAQPVELLAAQGSCCVRGDPCGDMCKSTDDGSTIGLVELMLKHPDDVDRLTRDHQRQGELVPRFLAISLVGFALFGIAATVMLNVAMALGNSQAWPVGIPTARWGDWSFANLTIAYVVGLIAATGVCLPSFYFFGLLAGVRPTMLGVLAHAMKGKSVAAVTLVGIVPIYVAVVLAMIVFRLPAGLTQLTLFGVLALPFVAGLNGVRSLYVGFMPLVDTLPVERRCRRACLLRRLVGAWSACYTVVTPLMVYTIWNHLS